MDVSIFKKMKIKSALTAKALFAPTNYPSTDELNWSASGQADFVHLFVESREQFTQRFPQAIKACKEDGLLWISYPKSKGKKTYDINRDSLWGLLLAANYHPVSQISLDDDWSAVRAKRNEAGVIYQQPSNVKK
ncbi:MAG: hypothetical protein LBE57_01805 [Methanosarcinales archaeon]|jgi:hypothetical protein|nr:hypothetical protein [Methanosarcinales archaeon]